MTIDVEKLREQAKVLLAMLPPEELPVGDIRNTISGIRGMLRNVPEGPWFLSDIQEDDNGSDFISMGTHEAPHYEETIAQFFVGNFSPQIASAILMLMNNIEPLLDAAERGLEK